MIEDAAFTAIMTMLQTLSEAHVLEAGWKAATTDVLDHILKAVTSDDVSESPVVAALDDIQQTLEGIDRKLTNIGIQIATLINRQRSS